ncbi:MAG TPA: hypothetical protein PLA90_05475 [Candidatus Sumerlaeota bacterium]|nr:hypothetical protein [Candidatus Sumerlaeota bacterium]HPS00974.1 hypothetical protein [Candidatus Sumerlaeota bacterium]
MLEPYSTTLVGLTLAVDAGHLILDESTTNSILSLHPAVTLKGEKKPRLCTAVEGFSVSSHQVAVTWKPVAGLELTTHLNLLPSSTGTEEADPENPRFLLQVRARACDASPIEIATLHPLCIPEEEPGACALGLEDLRTLGAYHPKNPPRLLRLRGGAIHSRLLAAWFSAVGTPLFLLAARSATLPWPTFECSGARGKMVGMRVNCTVGERLQPGETLETPPLLFVLGNHQVQEEIEAWKAELNDPEAASLIPVFDPSDTPIEEEPEIIEAPEAVEVPQTAVSESPEAGESQSDETDSADAEEGTDSSASDPEISQEPETGVLSGQSEVSDGEEETDPDTMALSWAITKLTFRGCAGYRRASAQTRSAQETGKPASPRWASGRRYQPIAGTSLRTRGYWRAIYPKTETE